MIYGAISLRPLHPGFPFRPRRPMPLYTQLRQQREQQQQAVPFRYLGPAAEAEAILERGSCSSSNSSSNNTKGAAAAGATIRDEEEQQQQNQVTAPGGSRAPPGSSSNSSSSRHSSSSRSWSRCWGSLDAKLQSLAKLLKLASTVPGVDHPLCLDCAAQLGSKKRWRHR